MARVTTVTCDHCKKVITDQHQIWFLEVRYKNSTSYHTYSDTFNMHRMIEVCRECLLHYGILTPQLKPNDPVLPTTPTLEQLIRDIVQDHLESQRQS